MGPRLRRQIGAGMVDRLDARLLVVGDNRNIRGTALALAQNPALAIDAQHVCHLLLKRRVAALEIVTHFVWLHFVLAEDLADRALSEARQTGMPSHLGVLPDVTRQKPRCPKLVRVSHLLRFLAGQRHHPCAAASVIVGSLPGRGLSSSAAITPNRTARSRH